MRYNLLYYHSPDPVLSGKCRCHIVKPKLLSHVRKVAVQDSFEAPTCSEPLNIGVSQLEDSFMERNQTTVEYATK